MQFKIPKIVKSWHFVAITICALLIVYLVIWMFFCRISKAETGKYVYIDDDDSIDSIYAKVAMVAENDGIYGFKVLSRYAKYINNIHSGAYFLDPKMSTWQFFKRMKKGEQQPVRVTIPSVRTVEKLASAVSNQLMVDSATLISLLKDESVCEQFDRDTATIACMIIPETYEMYWNISGNNFLKRMQTEYDCFWTIARKRKALDLNLSEIEVSILASIVEEETNNDTEKPVIAGLYYNRLQRGMPLQADPTVIFANKNFGAHRVYLRDLNIDSPYNTYKHKGLPPGPIRIASTKGLDAVLDMEHHNYLYMCAKEDFSGVHNFASTYFEHQNNANKYVKALNERGIK